MKAATRTATERESGFESKAERARSFATQMVSRLKPSAVAAEGAAYAYAHRTDEEWKPFESRTPTRTVDQGSAAALIAAFNT